MEQWPHAHKVALITGGCGGLGKAISEAFLLAGANVVVCDINKQRIADFKENISPAYPECTLVLECDITDDSQIDKMFEEAEQMFGKVNYVINNAGMMDRFDPVGEMERTAWDRVIALNLTAPAMVTKRAVNHMIKNEVKGSIVNIASIAGTRGFTNGAAYTASKHGLIGLTKNTAAFYGPKAGITCNAIMAGAMHTNIGASFMGTGFNMEGLEVMKKNSLKNEWKPSHMALMLKISIVPDGAMPYIDTAKVAKLVLFLCSGDGDIVNGAAWTVDGGATAN